MLTNTMIILRKEFLFYGSIKYLSVDKICWTKFHEPMRNPNFLFKYIDNTNENLRRSHTGDPRIRVPGISAPFR